MPPCLPGTGELILERTTSIGLVAAVIVLAVVLRAGILWKFRAGLAEDRDNYRRIAQQVVSGKGYSDPAGGQPTAYRPPLYPLLVALILRCGGSDLAIGIAQAIMGVMTVTLTLDSGRRLGSGRGSLVAGAIVAVDPLLLYQTSQVMTETTAAFLAAVCLWLCLVRPSALRNLLIGAAFGAACLCRPTFWAFGIASGLVQVLAIDWRRRSGDPGIRRAAVALVGVALVVGPWVLRNSETMGRPIFTTTHGGYTLLLAHNPAYTRAVVEQPWGTVWPSVAFDEWSASLETELAAAVPPLDRAQQTPAAELARDDWLNRKAWEYIRNDPLTAVKSGFTLLARLWNVSPAATEAEARSATVRLAIGLFYAPLLLAMLFGMARVVGRRWQNWWPCVALIVSFTAVHALYWADMRMRSPLVPAIALLAMASRAKLPETKTLE